MKHIRATGCGFSLTGARSITEYEDNKWYYGATYKCQGTTPLNDAFQHTTLTVGGNLYDNYYNLPQRIKGFIMTLSPVIPMDTVANPNVLVVPETSCVNDFDLTDPNSTDYYKLYGDPKLYVSINGSTYGGDPTMWTQEYTTEDDVYELNPGALEPMIDTAFPPVGVDNIIDLDTRLTGGFVLNRLNNSWRNMIQGQINSLYNRSAAAYMDWSGINGLANLINTDESASECTNFRITLNTGRLYTVTNTSMDPPVTFIATQAWIDDAKVEGELPSYYSVDSRTTKPKDDDIRALVEGNAAWGSTRYYDISSGTIFINGEEVEVGGLGAIGREDSGYGSLEDGFEAYLEIDPEEKEAVIITLPPGTLYFWRSEYKVYLFIGAVTRIVSAAKNTGDFSPGRAYTLFKITQGDCITDISLDEGGGVIETEYDGPFKVIQSSLSADEPVATLNAHDGCTSSNTPPCWTGWVFVDGVQRCHAEVVTIPLTNSPADLPALPEGYTPTVVDGTTTSVYPAFSADVYAHVLYTPPVAEDAPPTVTISYDVNTTFQPETPVSGQQIFNYRLASVEATVTKVESQVNPPTTPEGGGEPITSTVEYTTDIDAHQIHYGDIYAYTQAVTGSGGDGKEYNGPFKLVYEGSSINVIGTDEDYEVTTGGTTSKAGRIYQCGMFSGWADEGTGITPGEIFVHIYDGTASYDNNQYKIVDGATVGYSVRLGKATMNTASEVDIPVGDSTVTISASSIAVGYVVPENAQEGEPTNTIIGINYVAGTGDATTTPRGTIASITLQTGGPVKVSSVEIDQYHTGDIYIDCQDLNEYEGPFKVVESETSGYVELAEFEKTDIAGNVVYCCGGSVTTAAWPAPSGTAVSISGGTYLYAHIVATKATTQTSTTLVQYTVSDMEVSVSGSLSPAKTPAADIEYKVYTIRLADITGGTIGQIQYGDIYLGDISEPKEQTPAGSYNGPFKLDTSGAVYCGICPKEKINDSTVDIAGYYSVNGTGYTPVAKTTVTLTGGTTHVFLNVRAGTATAIETTACSTPDCYSVWIGDIFGATATPIEGSTDSTYENATNVRQYQYGNIHVDGRWS